MVRPHLFACACPMCGAAVLVPFTELSRPITPVCRCPTRHTVDTRFARREWDGCRNPRLLRECLALLDITPSARKRRLLAAGVGRVVFDWCRNHWFREAIPCGEELADAGTSARRPDDIRAGLERFASRYWRRTEWAVVGLACVADVPVLGLQQAEQANGGLVADVYRDLLPNPFLTIHWKPDWKTSTVLDLARTIYDRHAFDVMPILADAMLDSGCDHQVVQEHCRSGKPHARGCWVLDALLGLT